MHYPSILTLTPDLNSTVKRFSKTVIFCSILRTRLSSKTVISLGWVLRKSQSSVIRASRSSRRSGGYCCGLLGRMNDIVQIIQQKRLVIGYVDKHASSRFGIFIAAFVCDIRTLPPCSKELLYPLCQAVKKACFDRFRHCQRAFRATPQS